MKYLLLSIFLLSGCSFISPTNECRISYFTGQAESGWAVSPEADAKGDLKMLRVVQGGSGCKGIKSEWDKDGMVRSTIEKAE